MMIRRFVNIVAENYSSNMYSLHRLDVSKHLFYPSTTAQAQELPAAASEALASIGAGGGDVPPATERLPELPVPCMRFQQSPTKNARRNYKQSFFGLVSPRSSEGKLVCIDTRAGHTLLYDADSHSTSTMPSLRHPKGISPVSVSVARRAGAGEEEEEDIYVMHNVPDHPGFSGFEVLRFGTSVGESTTWQSLPSPPFTRDPRYEPNFVCSYAVLDDGRTICISSGADGMGTYCFDTVRSRWEQAGDWVLPFSGRAEYVPELKLWLDFSPNKPHYLCATSDLSSMTMDWPPKLQCVWRDLSTPDKWSATRINLINLGAGRFCIAKIFQVDRFAPGSAEFCDGWDSWDDFESQHAVLTGIEIIRNTGVDQNCNNLQGRLKLFKHKSILYKFMDDVIEWVL